MNLSTIADLENRRTRYRIISNRMGTLARWGILGAGSIIAAAFGVLGYLNWTGAPLVIVLAVAALTSGLAVADRGPGRLLRSWALEADSRLSRAAATRLEGWLEPEPPTKG